MSVIDTLIGKLAPYECLGCGREGCLLCSACLETLPALPPRCYRCHLPSEDYRTCLACLARAGITRVSVGYVYQGPVKDLVWKLKSNGARAAARMMARHMKAALNHEGEFLIVPAPTSGDRVRQRSYDQAALISRQLSKLTGRPALNCLARTSKRHQVGAGRRERASQLNGAFRVAKPRLVKNSRILLVDDVVTTGSTLEAAALALKRAGAAEIQAAVFAQPLMRSENRGLLT